MAGSTAMACMRSWTSPRALARHVLIWRNTNRGSGPSVDDVRCPCQKRAIFSTIGVGEVAIRSIQ